MKSVTVWRQRVRAWRASGQTAGAFVEGKGYAERTLRWWAWKLGEKSAGPPEPVPLLRVVRSSEASRAGHPPGTLEVIVGAARVSVGAGVERKLLRDVLEVLVAIEREGSW